jgi:DNA-binding response OmpR family regulator
VSYRILVVEDDQDLLELMGTWLSRDSFEIVCCLDGATALERIAEAVPDAAILDVRLPAMDAFELMARAKAAGAEFPVILFTGAIDSEVITRASEAGVADIVSKSSPLSVVEAKLHMVLGENVSAAGRPSA